MIETPETANALEHRGVIGMHNKWVEMWKFKPDCNSKGAKCREQAETNEQSARGEKSRIEGEVKGLRP